MNANHVVSLELAKKLKEAGYPQEGEFWWWKNTDGYVVGNNNIGAICSAPMVGELIELLPRGIEFGKINYTLTIGCNEDYRFVAYEYSDSYGIPFSSEPLKEIKNKSLLVALAKMYLYLAEHKLLEATHA
jgi:hypothetical protein